MAVAREPATTSGFGSAAQQPNPSRRSTLAAPKRLIGRERPLGGQLDIRCQTIYFQSDRMATVHLALDRVSGDPTVEWSRTVPIPSPTGREVGHRRAPAVQRVSQM